MKTLFHLISAVVVAMLVTGCSSTLLKSTVDYRAAQVADKAIADYDAQLEARVGSVLEERVRLLIRNEIGSCVMDMLPWGFGTLAGGGWLAAAAKKRRETILGSAQKSDNKET